MECRTVISTSSLQNHSNSMQAPQKPSVIDSSHSGYTPDWLRSFKGCSHYNDEQAYHIINSLKTLAKILVNNMSKKDINY